MLNILPQEQKITIQKEYSRRRVIVVLLLLAVALVISLVFLSPSYFLAQSKSKIIKEELATAKHGFAAKLPSAEALTGLSQAIKDA